MQNSDFLGKFPKNIDFPGKNWLFTAISGQIILFLFKSHHFRTYFLYMIRYNIYFTTRPRRHDPPRDPPRPPPPKSGGATPNPPGLTPMHCDMGLKEIEKFLHFFSQPDCTTQQGDNWWKQFISVACSLK